MLDDAVSYLSLTAADREAMLATIGVASVDDSSATSRRRALPPRARRSPPALSEPELVALLEELAARTRTRRGSCRSSAPGIYDHYVLAVVDAVLQRGEL